MTAYSMTFFSSDLLERVRLMTEVQREQFKLTSKRVEWTDRETCIKLVCYLRADGAILLDEMTP